MVSGLHAGVRDLALEDSLVRVVPLGLACCAVEVAAAARALGQPSVADAAPDVHVLVVAGTVTTAMVDEVVAVWESIPSPKGLVAYGACTISGGPYWDSYSVLPGLRGILPGAVEVAGCPPRPDVLVDAVLQAATAAVGEAP